MKFPALPVLAVTAFFLVFSMAASLGSEVRQRQHEMMRDALAPERIPEAEQPLLFEDDEFGEALILQRVPPPPMFTVFGQGAVAHHSNPLLEPEGSDGDSLFTGTLGAVVRPPAIPEWEPALSAEFFAHYQVFRFDDLSGLDFDAQSVGFRATYVFPYDINGYGGWTGTRMVDRDERDRFFRESQITLGANVPVMEERDFAVVAGAQTDLRHTSPGHLSRLDYGPYAGVHFLLREDVPMSFRYRLTHQHYLEEARDDLNSWVNISVGWNLNPSLALRLNGGYVINNSNRDRHDYDLATLRLGANVSYSF